MFIAVVVMVSVLRIAPEVRKKSDYETTRDRLNDAILNKKIEIRELRNKQQDFTSDHEFVEYILHQNRRVWKNETIFIFEDAEK
jgi:hypothetical protein